MVEWLIGIWFVISVFATLIFCSAARMFVSEPDRKEPKNQETTNTAVIIPVPRGRHRKKAMDRRMAG